MKKNCKNCGADYGLHHFETNQCPCNGMEAPVGRQQEWVNTHYEEDGVDVDDLLRRIEKLELMLSEYIAIREKEKKEQREFTLTDQIKQENKMLTNLPDDATVILTEVKPSEY